MQDGSELIPAVTNRRHAKRDTRRLDALLRPADALGHRRFRHQVGTGDLGGRQTTDGPQRQRDRRRAGQCRMTTHEQQNQRVVLIRAVEAVSGWNHLLLDRRLHHHHRLALSSGDVGAEVVGHAPRGDVDQPAARIVGDTLIGPLHRRREQRFLHGVFGGSEITKPADHRAEHLRCQLAQQVAVRICWRRHTSDGGALITSRTSIRMFIGSPPLPGAADARAAISYARCAVSQSTIQ